MELVKFFKTGGPFMYPILLVLALGSGYRHRALFLYYKNAGQHKQNLGADGSNVKSAGYCACHKVN